MCLKTVFTSSVAYRMVSSENMFVRQQLLYQIIFLFLALILKDLGIASGQSSPLTSSDLTDLRRLSVHHPHPLHHNHISHQLLHERELLPIQNRPISSLLWKEGRGFVNGVGFRIPTNLYSPGAINNRPHAASYHQFSLIDAIIPVGRQRFERGSAVGKVRKMKAQGKPRRVRRDAHEPRHHSQYSSTPELDPEMEESNDLDYKPEFSITIPLLSFAVPAPPAILPTVASDASTDGPPPASLGKSRAPTRRRECGIRKNSEENTYFLGLQFSCD